MKHFSFFCAMALTAAVSCCSIPEDSPAGGNGESREYRIEVLCDGYDVDAVLGTRSSFSSDALTKVNDVNIWIYSDGVLDHDHGGYWPSASGLSISFASFDDTYDIYMLANVGQVSAPEHESDLADWAYGFNDYGAFEQNGFPMANSFLGYTPGSQTTFRLKRLIGEYVISFADNSSKMTHTIRSVQLKNCALQVVPFSDGTACTAVVESGDYLSAEDIARLNAGGEVSLYFLENMQGVLLPGNTDPKKKTPDYISDSTKKHLCTYIEVDTEVQTPTASYGSVRYRAYLGQDTTSDFSIRRSTRYYLTLNFDANMVMEEEWRIEPDEPDVYGTLRWKSREMYIMKTGAGRNEFIIDVDCPDPAVTYTVSWDEDEAEEAMLSVTPLTASRYALNTSHPIDSYEPMRTGTWPPSCKDVHLYLRSYDGLLTDTAVVHVVHSAFPLRMYYDAQQQAFMAEAWHPIGFSLSFAAISCTVTGEGHYQKSGIAGDSWQTATESASWSISKYTVPGSSAVSRRHTLDKSSTSSVHGVMKAIESHTVLYDNTQLGTNHKYFPMHPVALEMKMQILVYSPLGYMQGDITDPLATDCPFYIYNEPDCAKVSTQYYVFDDAFVNSHTGTFGVSLSGSDMGFQYTHSNGNTYGFYSGGALFWKGESVNGGEINYTISGSTHAISRIGSRPDPVRVSVHSGSDYTSAWKGGSGTRNTR